ncbi:UNVERIFIED_ORG: hypothetical protein J2W60_003291 [Stenotrophomonas maltophilia]|nr:hypothetical protein [Stenotrophomonas maltophilia]
MGILEADDGHVPRQVGARERRGAVQEGRQAYTRAVQHVVEGKLVPQPVLAIEQERCGVRRVLDRESARAAMARAATDLGFGES